MAVTLLTMAEWIDEVANLTQLRNVGLIYLDAAPIWRAFGLPVSVPKGKLKVKWSDGATAGAASTGAGMTYTGKPGAVDDKFTLDFGVIACPAQVDKGTDLMGPDFAAQSSMQLAIAALHDKWVNLLVAGAGTGVDYDLWSAAGAIANEATAHGTAKMVVSGSYSSAEYDSNRSLLLDSVESANLLMARGDGSHNVCICTDNFYKNIKREVRKVGGNTASMVALPEFGGNFNGFNTLVYDNTFFYNTKHLSDANNEGSAYIFNVGPNGCRNVIPAGEDMFDAQGPKLTVGSLNEVWDMILQTQIIYQSSRSVAQVIEIAK